METLKNICKRLELGFAVHMDGVVRVRKKDEGRGVLHFRAKPEPCGRRPAVVISGTDALDTTQWCALTTVARMLMAQNGEMRVC